jgi:hypothetical protein
MLLRRILPSDKPRAQEESARGADAAGQFQDSRKALSVSSVQELRMRLHPPDKDVRKLVRVDFVVILRLGHAVVNGNRLPLRLGRSALI